MIRLLAPIAAISITACAQFDAPPAPARTTKTPILIGADKPVDLGGMTVVATALPPR